MYLHAVITRSHGQTKTPINNINHSDNDITFSEIQKEINYFVLSNNSSMDLHLSNVSLTLILKTNLMHYVSAVAGIISGNLTLTCEPLTLTHKMLWVKKR